MKYYTADLHLQHENILKYDNRPFNNINEHDEYIIKRINDVVGENDELFILWDIAWKWNRAINDLKKIKCKKVYFTPWNHDFSKYVRMYEKKLWWTNLGNMYIDKDSNLVIWHYPMHEWYHSHHKWSWQFLNVHWHSHWNSPFRQWRIDVWMTFKDFDRPISLQEIKDLIYKQTNDYYKQKRVPRFIRWFFRLIWPKWSNAIR